MLLKEKLTMLKEKLKLLKQKPTEMLKEMEI